MPLSKILLAYTLCASRREGEKIARECVKARLAACANVFAPATSFFHWKGKLEKATEFPVFLKTTEKNYSKLEKKIRELHSFELPCVVALPLARGEKKYLQWVESEIV